MTEDDFGIKKLSDEIGMSRSNLYLKIKSVSGQSGNAFIRSIRLRKAAEIFVSTDSNISEIAYMVGIKDVKYFREQFNKLFGMNPSEYIKRYRKPFNSSLSIKKDRNLS
jgi:AraC-like DNA-binding protein